MPVLADTNIWVRHFRFRDEHFATLLELDEVLTHPIVIGEVSMGNLKHRTDLLRDLGLLDRPTIATALETHHLVENHHLYGKGIQWNDARLLASAVLSEVPLWTHDKRLEAIAEDFGCAYQPTS